MNNQEKATLAVLVREMTLEELDAAIIELFTEIERLEDSNESLEREVSSIRADLDDEQDLSNRENARAKSLELKLKALRLELEEAQFVAELAESGLYVKK